MKTLFQTAAVLLALVASVTANAAIVKIDSGKFTSSAGFITFSEKPIGTSNPVFNPADYGGLAGSPVVSFGSYFSGQGLGTADTCPSGAALTGCVVGTPASYLSLATGTSGTFIARDLDNPDAPVLSGRPTFNGAVAILFDVDQSMVGLDGGYFNAIGGTAITAYGRDGSLIGSVVNSSMGIEFLGLMTDDGSAKIAGLLFSLVGSEPAGFAIDNLRFSSDVQVKPPSDVPEPPSLALFALALAGVAYSRKRKA